MTSFSIFRQHWNKIKKNLSKVLNTFENIMENRAFAPLSKCSIFHNIFKYSIPKASKGIIMEKRVYIWAVLQENLSSAVFD